MTACPVTLADGSACGAPALKADPEGLCLFHSGSPDAVRTRREGSRKGGLASHASAPEADLGIDLGSAEGILGTLQRVAEAVAAGRLDPRRASNLGYLLTTATAARKVAAYEERMKRIEDRLGINQNPLEGDDEDEGGSDAGAS